MKRSELYMSEDMLDELDRLHEENDVSRAEVVRNLVGYGLEHQAEIDFGEEDSKVDLELEVEDDLVEDLEDEEGEIDED